VLLPTSEGISIWRGQVDGRPLPIVVATLSVIPDHVWITPAQTPAAPDGVIFALFDLDVLQAGIVPLRGTVPLGPVATFEGYRLADAGDELALAPLGPSGPDQVVFALRGAATVSIRLVSKNLFGPGWWLPSTCEVALPAGLTVRSGARLAHADGDGRLDLLIDVEGGAHPKGAVAVALGNGDGTFHPPEVDERFLVLASEGWLLAGDDPDTLGVWPLAADDLNGDGVADFVSPHGVFMASPTPPHNLTRTYARPTTEPWVGAATVDVDGDGGRDVAAFSRESPRLDVLRCGELCGSEGRFHWSPYDLEHPATMVRSGRLRGNGFDDLVLLSRGPEGDAISVMAGVANDWPLMPRKQAAFHRVERMEVGRAPKVNGPFDDYEDVWITARSAGDVVNVGFLQADANGDLSSSLALQAGENEDYSAGHDVLLGRFYPGALPSNDAVFVGVSASGVARIWWLPGAEDAALTPTGEHQRLDDELGDDFDLACSRFASGDVEGDGQDEVVVAFGGALCGAGTDLSLAVGRVVDAKLRLERAATNIEATSAALVVHDLDGDGASEVVIATPGAAHLFDGTDPARTPTVVGLPTSETILDATAFARSAGSVGPGRIAILTDASLCTIDSTLVAKCRPEPIQATRVVSADLDRDGLGDLLLQTAAGVVTFLTVPAEPLGG